MKPVSGLALTSVFPCSQQEDDQPFLDTDRFVLRGGPATPR